MPDVILYAAMSLDGYLAREDGSVDWLEPTEDAAPAEELTAGYQRFYSGVDLLVMGRRTYDQVLGFGPWPYEGKTCLVFTHRPAAPDPNVEFVSGDPAQALARIGRQGNRAVWLVGGADLIRQFARSGLITEHRVTVIPTILGAGIPLFASGAPETRLRLMGVETIGGMVELRYAVH